MKHWQTQATPRDSAGSLSRRKFLGGAGAFAAGATGLLATGCAQSGGSGTITIVNTSATGAIALNRLLDEGGYFTTFGVHARITNVSNGTQVLAAVASGSADLTMSSGLIGVFPAMERGMKLKVLGGTQVVSSSALFSANPDVRSVRDLAGKTLGVGAVGAELYDVFYALLTKYGISSKDVTFRNVGSSADSMKAALAKQVDCGYAQVGNEALARQKDARMIATVNEELPLWINGGAVASDKAIAAKRQALVKVLAAYAKLFTYLATPESRGKYLAAYVAAGGSEAEGAIQWQFLSKNRAYSPTLELPSDKLDFIQKQNVLAGSQDKVLGYDSCTDLTLRSEALALLKKK